MHLCRNRQIRVLSESQLLKKDNMVLFNTAITLLKHQYHDDTKLNLWMHNFFLKENIV